MVEQGVSTTAVSVAWLRAAHQVVDDPPRILDDPAVAPLLGVTAEWLAAAVDRLQTPLARALRSHVVLRSRYAEDRLAAATARGVEQYIILGAGFDTFAYRQPSWAAALRVVEVDQPATQAMKREKVAAAELAVPDNVVYCAIDFERESLGEGLARAGFDAREPAFFAWLGVTMYLTEDAVDAVLRFVASLPRGSEIVFTFSQPQPASAGERAENSNMPPTLAEQAAAVGEPWISYFTPDDLERKLRGFGFSAIEFLTPRIAEARYFQGRTDGLPAPRRTSIVSAAV